MNIVTLQAPFDRITIEPGKMGGKACIRGLRISFENVLHIFASYSDRKELFENYPDLDEEDLRQALAYADRGARRCSVMEPVRPSLATLRHRERQPTVWPALGRRLDRNVDIPPQPGQAFQQSVLRNPTKPPLEDGGNLWLR